MLQPKDRLIFALDVPGLDRARALLRDAHVASQRDFESAANCVSIDGGDDQLRGVLHTHERLIAVQAEEVPKLRCRREQHFDVSPGAEEFVPGAPDHNHVHVFIEPCLENRVIQAAADRATAAR